jgi:hypothetical protein
VAMLEMAFLQRGDPLGSALYFMVTPGAPVRLHRIRNDQLHHYSFGDPLEVFLLHVDGTTEGSSSADLRSGHRVQLLTPGNTFHTARLIGRRHWFLGANTEWPDVEIGNVDELAGNISVCCCRYTRNCRVRAARRSNPCRSPLTRVHGLDFDHCSPRWRHGGSNGTSDSGPATERRDFKTHPAQ